MIKEILKNWQHDWHHQPWVFWLEAMGTVSSILASLLISFLTNSAPMLLVFLCWGMGSMSLFFASKLRKNNWMTMLMLFYSVVNAIGFYNSL